MKRELLAYHVKRCPSCATQKQFDHWREAAAILKPAYSVWFCADCTPTFQLENIRKGTCDHEYIKFYEKDNEIEGYVDREDYIKHERRVKSFMGDL